MKIIIAGAGAVGINLAQQLSSEGHDISIIEQSNGLVNRINQKIDVLAVVGHATYPSILEKARIKDAEMFVAVTDIDEVNIVACVLAKHFKVKMKIARVRNPELSLEDSILSNEEAGIDIIINPEKATVNSMVRIIETPGATEVADFGNGAAVLLGFDVPEDAPIAGKSILDLRNDIAEFPLVVAISREEKMIVPRGTDTIEGRDDIYVMLHLDTLPYFLPCINRRADEVQKVIIFGGTRISAQLALCLEARKINVTIIEEDEEIAKSLSSELSKTLVLLGSATDPDILKEAHINAADFFIALSEDDNANLMAALLARKHGAKKLMVLTNEPDFVPILESIDIDAVINPRIVTSNEILKVIRRGSVENVVQIKDGRAEGIQLLATKGQSVIGCPLKRLAKRMPEDTIVGAIIRSGQMLIPDGETVIEQGDSVVVFGLPETIPAIEKLFSKRNLFGG